MNIGLVPPVLVGGGDGAAAAIFAFELPMYTYEHKSPYMSANHQTRRMYSTVQRHSNNRRKIPLLRGSESLRHHRLERS